ncbi:DNA-binding protein [Polynucleobacter sp. 78F-HAINBA]|uniref:helix-turn-helix domain-containing transcriptional regulator n=1 Tax=Polynucleobacter sp. 78F-HAINBA TaxID=2689099 RepID=UPI00210482C6|nr:hypothetical protein [Polynucleobacter sp. 78F-HAINBA]
MGGRDKSHGYSFLSSLANPTEAAAYLDAVMELNDKEVLLVSLRHVAQANGIIEIDSLDESSNPTLDTMNRILHSVGLRLSVTELHA